LAPKEFLEVIKGDIGVLWKKTIDGVYCRRLGKKGASARGLREKDINPQFFLQRRKVKQEK